MRRVRPLYGFAALLAFIGLGSGCGDVSIPVDLALEQPSELSLVLPEGPASTSLVGGVETTIVADLGLLRLLGAMVGQALPADIQIDDVLIAGTAIPVFGGLVNTGTVCVFQDPAVPSSGSAAFNLLLGTAAFEMSLNTRLGLTDPTFNAMLGGPQAFTQEIAAVVPISLSDMLAIMGGTGGGLAISQDVDATFGPVPVLGTVHVTGTLTLASTDTPPVDPLLDDCVAYIAGLP
ncbi:MAG: hypothetical protein OZ948_17095 [Deltaproteobacteria bacterium]|nr:hypothetical protein [Deltaproteobacteria bacterium]